MYIRRLLSRRAPGQSLRQLCITLAMSSAYIPEEEGFQDSDLNVSSVSFIVFQAELGCGFNELCGP